MPEQYSRIFLLSHMRAFTSLAGHILGSHPAINGYYEMHLGYDDASALDRQRELFLEHDDLKSGSRYLFDKLLHNDYALQIDRPGLADAILLVSLREPEQTIKSIVNLFAQKEIDDLYASPAEAANYYIERLAWLADFCRTVKHDYYYFDAELLQTAPATLLPRLSDWLGLDSPLSDRYATFSQTGRGRRGDSSENIHSGTINKARNDYSDIEIPKEALSRAQEAYRDCRQEIMSRAVEAVSL